MWKTENHRSYMKPPSNSSRTTRLQAYVHQRAPAIGSLLLFRVSRSSSWPLLLRNPALPEPCQTRWHEKIKNRLLNGSWNIFSYFKHFSCHWIWTSTDKAQKRHMTKHFVTIRFTSAHLNSAHTCRSLFLSLWFWYATYVATSSVGVETETSWRHQRRMWETGKNWS